MSYVGHKIINIRRKLRLSQLDLAKKLQVSDGAISNYELNKRKFSAEMALKLVALPEIKKLNITMSDIYSP